MLQVFKKPRDRVESAARTADVLTIEKSIQAGCFPKAQAAKRIIPPVVEPIV